MKIGLRCLHTSPISCVICICQLLFWSSSFIVEALCGCAWSLSMVIGTLLFILVWICFVAVYFDKLSLWFDDAKSLRFGGAFLIAWRKWAGEDWSIVGKAKWR